MGIITEHNGSVKLTVAQIEALPNRKKKTAKEWSSACPTCGGEDRFLFWPDDGNYWCRMCGINGFVNDGSGGLFTITPEMKADWERKKREAEKADHERHITAVQRLQRERKDIIYHQQLNGNSGSITRRWGITQDTIDWFKVGYCSACPMSSYSDSITIPYYYHDKLINLRHRLNSPNGQGKYRPEMKGLSSAIFNADLLESEEWIVMFEGEFKAMVGSQYGLPTIAIPGATNFKEKWVRLFSKVQKIHIALDPGVEQAAYRIGAMLAKAGLETRIVTLPAKPDDMLIQYGCNIGTFCKYLEQGKLL